MPHLPDILIVRNDRLGDTILALPAINAIREIYPDYNIHFWAAPNIAPLIRCVQGVSEVIEGHDRNNFHIADRIKNMPIGIAYCMRATFGNAWVLKKSKIPLRIGVSRRWYSFLFNGRKGISRRKSKMHEADLNISLVRTLVEKQKGRFPKIKIPLVNYERIKQRFIENEIDIEDPYIVIHPGSGGSASDWPLEYFRELADLVKTETGFNVIVTGISSEKMKCRFVADDKHLDLSGQTNLLDLAALLDRSQLTICNSTGTLHLANALGRKVTGIYPPKKNCLPQRWGPYGRLEWALTPELPLCKKCQPGEISSCRCMETLKPSTVFEKCLDTLK